MIKLKKNLDSTYLYKEYIKKNRIMIEDILEIDSLNVVVDKLKNNTKYLNAYSLNGKYIQSSDEDLKSMLPNEMRVILQSVYAGASRGVGFFYGRYEVTINEKDVLLKELYDYLNNENTLQLISKITGVKALRSANVQLTRYVSGNFLTRHNDVLPSKQRAIAFVFGFTPEWHPDWGGLLHFYKKNGQLTDTFVPKNNVLSLFDVHLPHSVSYVAPFASATRYSITGWFNLN